MKTSNEARNQTRQVSNGGDVGRQPTSRRNSRGACFKYGGHRRRDRPLDGAGRKAQQQTATGAHTQGSDAMAGAGPTDGAAYNTRSRTRKQHGPKFSVTVQIMIFARRSGGEYRDIGIRENDGRAERTIMSHRQLHATARADRNGERGRKCCSRRRSG